MGSRLRVGLVGTGFIGAVHARSIRVAGADLVGVAASTPERGAAAAATLGAERGYESGLALATSGAIDVLHIATPNDLHTELALAALAEGLHVVCEKPIALSASEAEQMREAADAAGRIAAVPFVNRFHPMAREARVRAQSAEHGRVSAVHGSYLQDWLVDPLDTNWRVDADRSGASRAFADIGSHWCDLAEWIAGDAIVELVALTSTTVADRPSVSRTAFSTEPRDEAAPTASVETEDLAGVLFRLRGGAVGSVVVSQVAPGRKNRLLIEVDGAHRSVAFNQEAAEELWVGGQDRVELLTRDPAQLSEAAAPYAVLPAGHPQGFHDCFDAFTRDVYSSIAQGAPVEGLPTFDDGARSMRIVDAVLSSAAKRSWIEV